MYVNGYSIAIVLDHRSTATATSLTGNSTSKGIILLTTSDSTIVPKLGILH